MADFSSHLDAQLEGAYADLDTLIGTRFFAREFKLHQRNKALSLLTGSNKTSFRGRGIEFEEVRSYQPGDDIRSIDWRVTARSGKAYTKLFREERERPVLVVTDQRQGMYFGSQHCFKSVMACHISALLAWSGLNNGDRIGGLVFGNEGHQEVRPRRNRQAVLSLIHHMLDFNQNLNRLSEAEQAPNHSLAQALIEVRRIAKPGSAIYFVSDFSGFDDADVQKHLHQLSRHCEVTGFYIYDAMERRLPPSGQYTVTDGHQRNTIDTGGRKVRERYARHFDERLQALHHDCSKLGIPLIDINTDDRLLRRLHHYFGKQA
jgi:uncharacterized protein (DUF58 family)